MKVGDLVKHIEWEVVGLALQQCVEKGWLVYFSDGIVQAHWCSECELGTDIGGNNE